MTIERTIEKLHARYDATEAKVDRVLSVGGRDRGITTIDRPGRS